MFDGGPVDFLLHAIKTAANAFYPGSRHLSPKQARLEDTRQGVRPSTSRDPTLPKHLRQSWDFKADAAAMLRVYETARRLGLRVKDAEIYARALGQWCCREFSGGRIQRSRAMCVWRKRDLDTEHCEMSQRTYTNYWRCMVESGFVRGADGDSDTFDVANFININGGEAFIAARQHERRESATMRKRLERARKRFGKQTTRQSLQPAESSRVLNVSQVLNPSIIKTQPQGHGFENSIPKKSIKGRSTAELDSFQSSPRPLGRCRSAPNRTAHIAAKQAWSRATASVSPLAPSQPAMREVLPKVDLRCAPEPPPKLEAPTSALAQSFMAAAMARQRNPNPEVEARIAAEDAREAARKAAEAAAQASRPPPEAVGPAPTQHIATATQIAHAIETCRHGDWDIGAVSRKDGWRKLAEHKLTVADWVELGHRAKCAHIGTRKIDKLFAYLNKAAAKAQREKVTANDVYY